MNRLKQAGRWVQSLDKVGLQCSFLCLCTMMSFTVSLPFLQDHYDEVGCDDLCRGGLTSMRSALNIVGAYLVGRLSDNPRVGRKGPLVLGILSYFMASTILLFDSTTHGIWLGNIPSSLFGQVLSTTRAILSDYSEKNPSNVNRATLLGQVGLAAGVSFMVGPAIGALSVTSYREAVMLGMGCQVVAFATAIRVPVVKAQIEHKKAKTPAGEEELSTFETIKALWKLPEHSAAGIRLLVLLRFTMGVAYHIYSIISSGFLKHKFQLQPKGQAVYMGWIGLSYAISQGVGGKVIQAAESRITSIVLGSLAVLSFGRVAAFNSPNIAMLFLSSSFVVFALGVMNTVISFAASHLAESSTASSGTKKSGNTTGFRVGTMFGLLQTVESLAGLVGPVVGGYVAQYSEDVAMGVVAGLYLFLLFMGYLFFEKHISSKITQNKTKIE